jgi:MFS family permease
VIVLWASTFLCIVIAPFLTLGPVIAEHSLGGPAAWGLIAAGWGAGSLAGGFLALRWKPERPMLACSVLVLLYAPALALLALRAPAPVIAAAQVVGGLGLGFFSAVWQTTLQQHVPEEALSRVSAWDWMGSFAFLPLGLILAGPVSGAIGISTTLWISFGYLVVSTLVVLLVPGVRNLRRLDTQEPKPETALSAVTGDPAEALHG